MTHHSMLLKKRLNMKKNKIWSLILAFLLVIMCVLPCFWVMHHQKIKYDVWFLGDSIIAGDYNGSSVPAYVAAQTGLDILNAGFGGMTMSRSPKTDRTDVSVMYTMTELSEGIANNDLTYTALNSLEGNPYNLPYWEQHARALSEASFSSPRYVFINFGTNDFFNNVPLDDENNRFNTYTYGGALRSIITNVRAGMPQATIILLTSPYNSFQSGGTDLKEYVSLEMEIADSMGIEVINNYELSGINKDNYEQYLSDGIHPNAMGVEALSRAIIDRIKE